ncbi:MAG: protein kinase [Myxococcales bacterium]|nr:protein kinase [Myxococcales bacterium]
MAKLGPGAKVGDQFHLIRKIGEGGCGEVFLAEQTTLGRHTVVKLMHPELSRDASYVERFRREARLAARLIHHHTAAIYAFGETPDKVLWIAMEYIEGESLHNVLARESPRQIAELLNPVADVLDRAASMGIIHREAYRFSMTCFLVGHFRPQRRRNKPCLLTAAVTASLALT